MAKKIKKQKLPVTNQNSNIVPPLRHTKKANQKLNFKSKKVRVQQLDPNDVDYERKLSYSNYLDSLFKIDSKLTNFEIEKANILNFSDLSHDAKRKRLAQLIINSDKCYKEVPSDVQTWSDFAKKNPAWNTDTDEDPSLYVFFIHQKVLYGTVLLAQRAQLSSLCYIHAPVLLQHYLVTMHANKNFGMTDISSLINSMEPISIWNHIITDAGGSSVEFLKSLLEEKSILSQASYPFEDTLRKYGPILISGFRVRQELLNSDVSSHIGFSADDEIKGLHAMLIVGVRRQNGKELCLIQNTWKNKQFFEVDEEYLNQSLCSFYYVKTPQQKMNAIRINICCYAENEYPGEKYPDEKIRIKN